MQDINFCCICIETNLELDHVSIKDENGIKHCDKLRLCVPNQNWMNETLGICEACKDKLNYAYEFIKLCKNNENLRVEKFNQLQEEKQKEKLQSSTFTCYTCGKSFRQKRFLKMHITRIHLSTSETKPKFQTFENKVEEKENAEVIDSNISDIKTEEYEDTAKIEKKELNYDDDLEVSADNDKIYSSDDEKPKRKKIKKPEKRESLTCEYCGKQFNRHQHWSAHIRSKHTFEKPYKCKLCDASFVTSHSLLVHKRNHNNEKPYICSICGKGFVCSGDLFHHTKIHLNKKEYQCNICSKRFNTSSILRTHKIVKHTEPKDWKYVCNLCDRRFPINSGLSLHMKRHSGIKDHVCHICGKKFFNKSEVTKHILSHSNDKHFKCSYCNEKEYKNREGLNKHLKMIHNIGNWKPPKFEKKFLCPQCPKMFIFNNKLQRHILTHTGEKPFKCDYCEKKFSDNYYRKSHMKKEHSAQFHDDSNYTDLLTVVRVLPS